MADRITFTGDVSRTHLPALLRSADLLLSDANGAPVRMELDFRHSGPPRWDIEVDTDAGRLSLSKGGGELRLNSPDISFC